MTDRGHITTLLAIGAAGILLAGCSSESKPAQKPTDPGTAVGPQAQVVDCAGRPSSRPERIDITCADANLSVSAIIWEAWTATAARGNATENRNICEPSCAEGEHKTTPATVELTNPVDGMFTRITVSPVGGKSETSTLPSLNGPAKSQRTETADEFVYCGSGTKGLAVFVSAPDGVGACAKAMAVTNAYGEQDNWSESKAVTVTVDGTPWSCQQKSGNPNPYQECVNQHDPREKARLSS
ncbi:hypothetical protein [Nocardia altamirensis]|uniref:hypothetical protein n=1 Tax=Nocardia altamirensis TaxID=472158 RepID=UPI00083FF6C5|nr:hypothetical protein [Nocardia altamirensis]